MQSKDLVNIWFQKWQSADIGNLPVADNFSHTSPFGTIHSKMEYLDLVKKNRDKFLGHRFKIHSTVHTGTTLLNPPLVNILLPFSRS